MTEDMAVMRGMRAVVLVEGVSDRNALEVLARRRGELRSFRILQVQPAQRGRSTHDQLHRFLGSRSGRKHRYGSLLAGAVDLSRVPRSLDGVIASV